MKVSYFPGCTLRTKAKQLDFYARRCAEILGVELCELENWQCCGGVFVSAKDEIASKLPSVRALAAARDAEQPLVTVCSACHNVIKQTNYAMQNDADFAAKVNCYMSQDPEPAVPYAGETQVYHYLELLRDVVGFDKIKEAVVKPLTGRKIAAYYGCLLLRPGKVMQMDDVENPVIMEDLIRALGAEPVIYARRNECCGGYVALEDPASAKKKSNAVSENAAAQGAELMVTACPLCKYNLVKNGSPVPVVYFTELLAEALGVKEDTYAE
ncbi:CoB--CoM heterodisulfide reductase iron-sulfur subunit B family protein [Ruminococcus sp.]|uniref:CoB--CoM heterodisulfide reductase iron-sulfur subunit B family protein n=1 Tax=Ruminococcus sp. TaxID=41978 RepID=UPI0025F43C9D|nr:CoB--CoM heterodisulfide reductase iron-sulfur subunit B family protein [Ruminococcus sp.]MCI5815663.1 CoB--CoM heterodisulfide reductase iron-sulfur subunit B family protein [Ruminococcus sp.]MDD7556369.1 CoB--CoM heterodisulfide reductase iron-sulfur subunit B family protein [Ruminococcus sp.]MDY4964076.1 CoB--CoM heterodisulfide reductase iron-sulfur subunit B family protein [Ruminococcus callidus]